jgi:pimeloyl-ACP methyl ester carboxylesterase
MKNLIPRTSRLVGPTATLVRYVLAAACLFGAAHVAYAQTDSAPPFPPPGKLVDVGGWRLHINCLGSASPTTPTVILESGLGDFSVEWGLVQPGVASFARVCTYDRAGDGWSDVGPYPRTFHQIVYELHTLLEKAGERPPYVLAGHSYGGWLVRLFQSTYPADVSGVVLVDAGAQDPWRLTSNGTLVRSSSLAKGTAIPSVKTSGPLRDSDIPPGAMSQILQGTQRAALTANEPPRDKLPAAAKAMRTWALGRWQHVVAANNPFEADELLAMQRSNAGKEYPLGDLPLIVLTRGLADDTGPDAKAFETEHRQDHLEVSRLSRAGRLIVAQRSGHHIQIEQPDLVVEAIRDVVLPTTKRK